MDDQIALIDNAIQILPESIIEQFRAEEQERRKEQTSKDIVRQRPGKQGQTLDYITFKSREITLEAASSFVCP